MIDSFQNCKILKMFYFSKLNNKRNLMVSEIEKFGKFSEFCKWKFFSFLELKIFEIFEIWYFWNFPNWQFRNFPHWKFLESFKFKIFWIFQIKNLSSFSNLKFLELSKLEISGISQIWNFWNYLNWKINKFLDFFSIAKTKMCLQKLEIFQLSVYSMFHITRNFANCHIFPLI